jgi:hypothetical protein
MRRAIVVAIVVAEAAVAALCAAVFGFVIAIAAAYGERAGNMHGGVPPLTEAERSDVDAAGYWAFGLAFVVVWGLELALTAVVLRSIRRQRERALRQDLTE